MASNTEFLVNIPIYGGHTNLLFFPSLQAHKEVLVHFLPILQLHKCNFIQNVSKFTLLTNEMKPLKYTGSLVPVPFLPGHDYVLVPGVQDGFLRTTYSAAVPDCLQNFAYALSLRQPEVSVFSFFIGN